MKILCQEIESMYFLTECKTQLQHSPQKFKNPRALHFIGRFDLDPLLNSSIVYFIFLCSVLLARFSNLFIKYSFI